MSAAGSSAQQQAASNEMLATYARDISSGVDAGTVSKLDKQIMAAAKALGQGKSGEIKREFQSVPLPRVFLACLSYARRQLSNVTFQRTSCTGPPFFVCPSSLLVSRIWHSALDPLPSAEPAS